MLTIIPGYTFPKMCANGACVFNPEPVRVQRAELSREVKDMLARKQQLTTLMLEVNKNCLNGLADVTNKLIIDTAQLIGSMGSGFKHFAGEVTAQGIDNLGAASPTSVSAEDFIATNCKLYQSIQPDLDALDKKIAERQDKSDKLSTFLVAEGQGTR